MNGIHDMGGMHGFGRVDREENEPVFHAAWESRVLGLSRACSAQHLFNIDESRHAIERMAPVDYLGSSYYERWLDRTVRLLVEKGVITREELERRMAQLASGNDPAPPHRDPKLVDRMLRATKERTPYRQPGPPPPFASSRGATRRWGTRGCHVTPAASTASSIACTGRSSSRTRTPTGRASSLTRCTASASTPPSCGARPPSLARLSISISGSGISIPWLQHPEGARHERRPRRARPSPSRA